MRDGLLSRQFMSRRFNKKEKRLSMKKHSVGWNVAKLLTKKVKFHRTVNVILAILFLSTLLAAMFVIIGGK